MATLSIRHRELWTRPAYLEVGNIFSRWHRLFIAYHRGLWQAPCGLRTVIEVLNNKAAGKSQQNFHRWILMICNSHPVGPTWPTGAWDNFETSSSNHVAGQRTHWKKVIIIIKVTMIMIIITIIIILGKYWNVSLVTWKCSCVRASLCGARTLGPKVWSRNWALGVSIEQQQNRIV